MSADPEWGCPTQDSLCPHLVLLAMRHLPNTGFCALPVISSFVIDVLFLSRLYALQNTHVANSNAHRGAFVIAAQPKPNALTIHMYMLLFHQTTCSPLCCYVISTHPEASADMPHLYASHLTWLIVQVIEGGET